MASHMHVSHQQLMIDGGIVRAKLLDPDIMFWDGLNYVMG